MGVVCALVSCTIAYADGPVKEGNAIVGHVIDLKSATPFPKCYLHKEKWTFDS